MTFLNPLVLMALAASGIPLLLHLLNLRKLRTIDFSSLRFLKELQRTRIRRLKLRQLLLLLLRIGLVVFAVLAFARPALRSTIGLPGAHASTTAVILLDNSFSMSVRDPYGERFRQAKAAALNIVESLERDDEAYIVPMASPRMADVPPSRSRETLRRALGEMKTDSRRADLEDGLRVAAAMLDRSGNLNREIYLITDAQEVNAPVRPDSTHIFDAGVRLYLVPVGTGTESVQGNVGVDSLRIITGFLEPGKPVEVRAWLHNYGTTAAENVPAAMYFENERLAQSAVNLAPGATVSVDFSAQPRRGGMTGGYVEIRGDALEADNRRYFAFAIPERLNVALVGTPETTRFIDLVLGISQGRISVRHVAPASVGSLDLGSVSAVILADAAIPQSEASRLGQYVQDGGGVVFYAGENVLGNNPVQTAAALGVGIGAPVGADTAAGRPPVTFGAVVKEHPLFSGVFDAINTGPIAGSPVLLRVLPPVGGQTVIGLTNGVSFLTEFRRGRGRIIYVAVPPTNTWGDFATKEIFVPIVLRSALYVGSGGDLFPSVNVGQAASVPLPWHGELPPQVRVIAPDGRDEFVAIRQLPSGALLRYGQTNTPGVYRVGSNGKDLALFCVNFGDGESDLRQMSDQKLRGIVAAKTVQPANVKVMRATSGDYAKAIGDARFGLELWKYMLGLALLCAFAEMLVGRSGGGGSPVPDSQLSAKPTGT